MTSPGDRPAAEAINIPMCNSRGLVFLQLLNNLRRHTGLHPVEHTFACTGSAHLAGAVFRCTNPVHDVERTASEDARTWDEYRAEVAEWEAKVGIRLALRDSDA